MKRCIAIIGLLVATSVADAHGPLRKFVANFRGRIAERQAVRQGFVNPVPVESIPSTLPQPMPAPSAGVAEFQRLANDKSFAGRLQLRKRIAEFREGVKAELKKRGVDADDINIVGQLGDGKLLEWIILHGPDIIKFVEMLLALFGKEPTVFHDVLWSLSS